MCPRADVSVVTAVSFSVDGPASAAAAASNSSSSRFFFFPFPPESPARARRRSMRASESYTPPILYSVAFPLYDICAQREGTHGEHHTPLSDGLRLPRRLLVPSDPLDVVPPVRVVGLVVCDVQLAHLPSADSELASHS